MLKITSILKSIQAVISSQPGLTADGYKVDNRLSIIKRKVNEYGCKDDFFYYLLIKLISMNLSKIYNRKFSDWIGLVLSENEELIPQPLSNINNFISSNFNYIDAIQQADCEFSINLFEYVCDILESNRDIMLDAETLIRLLDRRFELSSSNLEGQHYQTYNFSRLAKIMKENHTLEKSNISLDDTYQILMQTNQFNNEDVFGFLVNSEEFKKILITHNI